MTTTNVQDIYQSSYRAGTIAMTALGVPGPDDYVILAALVPLFILVGLMLASPGDIRVHLCHNNSNHQSFYSAHVLRHLPHERNSHCLHDYCGVSIAWGIAIILVSVFQCTPIARAWDTRIPGTCINLKASFIGNAVPNIVTDILILSLPVRVVWGLHASITHRLSIIGIFLLGSLFVYPFLHVVTGLWHVIFTSVYRFTTLFEFNPTDIAWTLGKSCTWCIVESSTGIISACMPTLRPLFLILPSKFSSQSGTQRTRTTDVDRSKGYELDNSALRPANEPRNKTKVHLDVSHADDGSEDEVPLNAIRVQQDMTWHESRGDSLRI
ncbi:hypothetical protein N7465_002489 [Penicillium sp. CMV-2018d]|nr:hypothetical protein N7465_002489 [Penicillium sp. CMV-2018d]